MSSSPDSFQVLIEKSLTSGLQALLKSHGEILETMAGYKQDYVAALILELANAYLAEIERREA